MTTTAKPPYLPLPIAKRTRVDHEYAFDVNNIQKNNSSTQRMIEIGDIMIPSDYNSFIIFDSILSKELNLYNVRLPPQYIGVRRIRPSCKSIQKVLIHHKQQQQKIHNDYCTLWIIENEIRSTNNTNIPTNVASMDHTTTNTSCGDVPMITSSLQNATPIMAADTQKEKSNNIPVLTELKKVQNVINNNQNNEDIIITEDDNTTNQQQQRSLLTFKTFDEITGIERRMNSKEKRLFKMKMNNEKKNIKQKCTKIKVEILEKRQKEKKILNKIRKKQLLQQQGKMGTSSSTQEVRTATYSTTTETKLCMEDDSIAITKSDDSPVIDSSVAIKEAVDNIKSNEIVKSNESSNDKKQQIVIPMWHQQKQQQQNNQEQQEEQQSRQYVHLNIDQTILEQELADLRGDRDGVPPVLLPFPLVSVALKYKKSLFVSNNEIKKPLNVDDNVVKYENHQNEVETDNLSSTTVQEEIVLDDQLANQWVRQLKHNITFVERLRQMEKNIRPMPYQLTPEVWTRLRPNNLGSDVNTIKNTRRIIIHNKEPPSVKEKIIISNDNTLDDGDTHGQRQQLTVYNKNNTGEIAAETVNDDQDNTFCKADNASNNATTTNEDNQDFDSDCCTTRKKSWNWCQIRSWNNISPKQRAFDATTKLVIEMLYKDTNIHISCGAKFGCDYLLYDGPRNERHAFAGLRIITFPTNQQPLSIMKNKNNKKYNKRCLLFPQQTPYELSGYVRCLNTAGKLALLATVYTDSIVSTKNEGTTSTNSSSHHINNNNEEKKKDEENTKNESSSSSETTITKIIHRVAIIDLALEKIISTTVNRPKKTLALRLQQLSKT